MAVAPKSIAILFTPLITFQPFIHWQWFYNKIIWGEYSNCHQTIILGLYIFLDHILSRTIDQKFWWSTPPPFCHSFFLFLGLSVFSSFRLSVFLSFCLSVFPSFCLSLLVNLISLELVLVSYGAWLVHSEDKWGWSGWDGWSSLVNSLLRAPSLLIIGTLASWQQNSVN